MSGRFRQAFAMERVRLLTLRSTAVLAAVAVLLSALVAVLLSAASHGEGTDPGTGVIVLTGGAEFVPLPFVAVLMGVLGVLGVAHDYRHGLIRPLLTAQPSRSALVLARLAVLSLTAVTVTLISFGVNVLVCVLITGQVPSLAASSRPALFGYVLLVVLWTWLGAAATWLLRNSAVVLTVLLIVPLIVEPTLATLPLVPHLHWLQPMVPWLPFSAGRLLAAAVDLGGSRSGGGPPTLSRVAGGLVFGALVLAVLVPAWARLERKDA